MNNLHLTLLAFICFFSSLSAQSSVDSSTTKIKNTPIVRDENGNGLFEYVGAANGTKDELFSSVKSWIFDTFKSGKSVIQNEDREAGMVICNAYSGGVTFSQYGKAYDAGGFKYNFKISVKDSKYRITITDIKYEKGYMALNSGADITEEYPSNWTSFMKKKMKEQWDSIKMQGESNLKSLVENLDKYLSKSDNRW